MQELKPENIDFTKEVFYIIGRMPGEIIGNDYTGFENIYRGYVNTQADMKKCIMSQHSNIRNEYCPDVTCLVVGVNVKEKRLQTYPDSLKFVDSYKLSNWFLQKNIIPREYPYKDSNSYDIIPIEEYGEELKEIEQPRDNSKKFFSKSTLKTIGKVVGTMFVGALFIAGAATLLYCCVGLIFFLPLILKKR